MNAQPDYKGGAGGRALAGWLTPLLACAAVALLYYAAAVNANRAGASADVDDLFDAVKHGDAAAVERSLARGRARVDALQDGSSMTPLMYAARCGHVSVVELLLARGANLRACASAYGTPLANAAAMGHAEVVRLLLARGADPGAGDADGHTPLMLAAQSGDERTVGLLLRAGADSGAADRSGNTAGGIAEEFGNARMAGMLISASRHRAIQLERQRLKNLGVERRMAQLDSEIPRRQASSG
jgi:serine/threonine-protein phosphatase 6 regulatory ankyrin repeat subunit C